MKNWNAQRLLATLLELSDYEKPWDNELTRIMYARIQSVLNAFIANRCNAEKFDADDTIFRRFCDGEYVDDSCSADKIAQLYTLTGITPYSQELQAQSPFVMLTNLDREYDRRTLFKMIMTYRLKMEKPLCTWAGLIEASGPYYAGYMVTKRLADDKIKECARQLDEILILLLGDTFDKTFTEDELLADYGYPAMTDEQLQELKAEWCE